MQERNAAGLDAEQVAAIHNRDGSAGDIAVFRREANGVFAIGQALVFRAFAEQGFISVLVLACLRDGLRDGLEGLSVRVGRRGQGDGFHTVFAVERQRLSGLGFLCGGGEERRGRRGGRRFAGSDALSQLAVRQRGGSRRYLGIQRDIAGFNGILKRGHADSLTGRRTDQQGKRFVGEIAVGRDIERREVRIRRKRGNDAGGGRRVRLGGGKRLTDQLDDLLDRQAAVRQETRNDRTVRLKLGGKHDVAAFRSGSGEHGQNACQSMGDAIRFVAQRIIKHDIAVCIDKHLSGNGGVGIDRLDVGKAVDFAGIQHDGAGCAGNRLARERNADDPGAVAAGTDDACVVGIQTGVEIERAAILAGRRRQGKACAGGAGNERRHAGERVFAAG